MKKHIKYLSITIFSICSISLYSTNIGRRMLNIVIGEKIDLTVSQDTIIPQQEQPKFPVKKSQIITYEDINQSTPIDLKDPQNMNTYIEYDEKTNQYVFRTKFGEQEIVSPYVMTREEYSNYLLRQSMNKYFRRRNAIGIQIPRSERKDNFFLKNVQVNTGSLDRIFGPGGVKLNINGYAEAGLSLKNTKTDNPTLSEKNRNRTVFDFNQDIQMNVSASVGEKINFGLNYDTKAAFDFDSKRIKLGYEGDEDEIIKKIEAGNVSMSTTNSLINGGSALFGINTEMQFGKLHVNTIIAQQEAESRTLNTQGSVQNIDYQFKADEYDENRHFFLAHYFRDNYDNALSQLPTIISSVSITRMEVWVTNKRGNNDQSRNIVAFADLGEHRIIKNTRWAATGTLDIPYNNANDLYKHLTTDYSAIRDKSNVTSTFNGILESGQDYEKLEGARLLSASEYSYNQQLGYLSLSFTLQSDEVLAVAFEYRYKGQTYQVGEFAADIVDNYEPSNSKSGALFLKLLKPVSLSPQSYSWDLMMKNVYSLNANNIQKEGFRLQIAYQSDTIGTYLNYLTEGNIKNKFLLNVMRLDRLDSRNNVVKNATREGDGIFDFIEGVTIRTENGRIYFPVVEPFGSYLAKEIGDNNIANRYVYQELYDLTKTAAQQTAEKNKFKIYGSYRGNSSSSGAEINLNATNVPQGSVRVTAGGVNLTEGTDYIVDYMAGTVTIINQSLLESSTPVQVSLEDRTFNMQRKTLLGLNLSYDISKDFTVGGTIMHLYEKPLTTKTAIGEESVKNTLWGLNLSFRTQSEWLTNMIDKLPFVEATQPSQISFTGEFAQLIAGHYEDRNTGKYSYLDDFESSESRIDLKSPYAWTLSSVPSYFSESKAIGDSILESGKNRALLSWFMIDRLFTRKGSSLTPRHITNDDKSNHYVREIRVTELYPYRDLAFDDAGVISALNLSFYPNERGPYNLDAKNINSEGKLNKPQTRWGGITRKMDVRDFESSNIEYIEFWLMDPFIYNDTLPPSLQNKGGELYINLGEISEDILKDGKKFYENGLPINNDDSAIEFTKWGKVPKRQSLVYAFDNEAGASGRKKQDVGLNGLSTEEEKVYPTYKNYLENYRNNLSPTAFNELMANPFSPFNDPAGDNYHFYRSSYYDEHRTSILDRYKYFNGTEGNSPTADSFGERYSTASRTVPDVEDIDQDNTMNETESYYQYKIDLKPAEMQVGKNFITEARPVDVNLPNGKKTTIKWYQFKVPVQKPTNKVGNISNFKSIRFMRMFLTAFEQTTFLRFGTLQLVRGDWRVYDKTLNTDNTPSGNGSIEITRVNIEEDALRKPVSYVLPPGLNRSQEANQAQVQRDNEQSLSMKIIDLDPKDARAIYKNTNYDLRRYKRLQLFTHLEELIDGSKLEDGDFTVFIRLGSDFKSNYYEYEIPMLVTPAGDYNWRNDAHRSIVWPSANLFDISLELLKDIKLHRNAKKRQAGSTVTYTTLYSEYDPQNQNNKISVIGNPSLANVYTIMIGVRNNSRTKKSGEVWVNELRLTDFDEKGGWAAQGNLNIALSDIGTINLSGRKETAGFGALDQSLRERRSDDYRLYNIALNMDLGRFVPEKVKASIPFYYSYSNQKITPEYDPFDTDVKLKESLKLVNTKAEKDSIKSLAEETVTNKSISFTNVRFNHTSKTPMPYDPANFSFSYSYNETETRNPTTVYDIAKDYKASLNYSYSPVVKTWEPFKGMKKNNGSAKFFKSLGFNYLPNNVSFNSLMSRFYTETLTRDIESYYIGGANNNEFLSWSQAFYWDRDFSLNWDLTRNLKLSLQTGTRAEIEEPYLQVNKKRNRPDYEKWKDSVWQSIKNWGDPLEYRQIAKVTYQLPMRNIPALDWVNSSASYTSGYQWQRGAHIGVDSLEIGNTINNNITLETINRLDLTSLYRKSAFLKQVNERFASRRTRSRNQQQNRQRQQAQRRKKRFKQEIILQKDSTYKLIHNLDTKKLDIIAKSGGKTYKLKYKKLDNNTILITNKDSAVIQLNIAERGKSESSEFWKDVAEYTARGLMSIRNITFNYSTRAETNISGFKPKVGDMFGQKKSSDYGMVPGLGFAFGFDGGESYVDKSLKRDWLLTNSVNTTPAIYNHATKLDLKAEVEPFKGLKIEFVGNREKNDRTEIQYMYDLSPKLYGGSFSITTIALSSAFDTGNAKNGYKSKAFQRFIENRHKVRNRLERKYDKTIYPNIGFISTDNIGLGNTKYKGGDVDINSSDVLVPAFLAAYTGKDANKISLTAFPSLLSMLPNWNLTYDGLIDIPFIKQYFKSIRLAHKYSCFYQVGSYSSYGTWIESNEDGLGFIRDVLSGKPIPSSRYNISSVNITEYFDPLFSLDGVMNNNMTFTTRYNTARILNLNIPSYQIIESQQKEWVVGLGYRINDFNRIVGLSVKSSNGINNDLNLKADLSYQTNQALIRKIEENYTQATSGTTVITLKLSADYTMTRALTLRAFFDRILNKPLITSVGYPTTNSNFGISLKFTLLQ